MHLRIGESSTYSAAVKTFTPGNATRYDKAISPTPQVSPGATIYAGWRRTAAGNGFWWDRDDGSGKTTKAGEGYTADGTGWATWNSASKPNVYVTYQYDVDSSLEGPMGAIVGIARSGTSIWVLDDLGTLFQYNQADLAYVGKTTAIAAYITGAKAGAGLFWDGTNLVVATASGTTGTDQVRLVKCTAAGAYSSTLTCSGLAVNGSSATVRGGCLVADPLNGNAPTYRLAVGGAFAGVYGFVASTGANTANRDFGLAGEVAGGVTHDGTAFRGWAAAAPTSVWTFTTWDWSTATQPFWLAYSWYDDVGTVHETRVGPRAGISLGRRRQLGVTLPSVPAGGADDPSKLNLYMLAAAADPGTGSGTMKLQATTTATQLTLTSYSAGGAADPASNNFPGGTPAVLRSQTGTAADSVKAPWALKGDGTKSGFLRFVRISRETVRNGVQPNATQPETVTPTTLPTDGSVYAVQLTIGIRDSGGGNAAITAVDYAGGTAGSSYSSGVASRGGFAPVGPVLTGGTNNRQFKLSATTGATVTIWCYVEGYWTYA
jgi:hypothetical protein